MEKSSPIKLIKPNISQDEIDAVTRVLNSGMLVSGPAVLRFERLLANYLGAQYAVCVSSGTAALHLALLAADIRPDDEVLVPAFTFPATANMVEAIGAIPIFVDCQPGKVNLDADKLEDKISSRTKAIIPVHAFGIPAEMDKILYLAGKHKLTVIEDAACALGSKFKNQYCGRFGDMAIFSFHPRKLLTTGEGGVIVTNNKTAAAAMRSLRNHGFEDGDFKYLGFNYRLTDFQAAMGISQIEEYGPWLDKRKQVAREYNCLLRNIEWLELIEHGPEIEPNYQTYLVLINENIDRNSLIEHLFDNGIEATIGTYCVPLTHYYRLRYGYYPAEFPEAFKMFKRCLSLPLYNDMKSKDVVRIVSALESYLHQEMKVSV